MTTNDTMVGEQVDMLAVIRAAKDLYIAVHEETEALRAFKGCDGEGLADCKVKESRVVECMTILESILFANLRAGETG